MNATSIEWTDRTWNPVTGCTKVSPGCDHCYAEGIARRFAGGKAFPHGFDVTLHEDRIEAPLRWRKPSRVFVNSMSDLFHDDVPDLFLTRVFDVMEQAREHTFQVLTKRHGRMRSFLRARQAGREEYARAFEENPIPERRTCPAAKAARRRADNPPANIWIGVSVEDQKRADLRIPALLQAPAAVRFLSCEPLLGPVDLLRAVNKLDWLDEANWRPGGIDWVIAGGESGPGARPMHPAWARQIRDQCIASGVPFFFKQWGKWGPVESHEDWLAGARWIDAAGGFVDVGEGHDLARHQAAGLQMVQTSRAGKKLTGRELDGRTWDDFPAVTS